MLSPRPAKTAGYWPIFGHPLVSYYYLSGQMNNEKLCPVKLWHPQFFSHIQSYVFDATKTTHIYDNIEMHHTRTFSLSAK